MPSAREDYLIRLIHQLAALARRLRERLTKASAAAASPQELAAIGREADEGIGALLGPQAALLQHLDAASAVALVGAADRVALWVELLEIRAGAARAEGQEARAAQLGARAEVLRQAAAARWPDAPGAR